MSKYNNKKIEFDGITFDSEMEKDFYIHLLKTFDKSQIIIQPKFELQPKFTHNGINIRAITYIADFQVANSVFDVKGFSTTDFLLKEKMFKYKFQNLDLMVLTKAPKYTGKDWISISDLKKVRKERKCKK